MTVYCPRCNRGYATVKAMEDHVVKHPDYDYDKDRKEEPPTAEEEE